MGKLNQLLQKLQDANVEFRTVTTASTMKAIKQRMAKDIDEVGKIAIRIKTKLNKIDKDNAANRQKPGCGEGTGVDRSRVTITTSYKKKLKKRMTDFQTLRENINDVYREVFKRRVSRVTGNCLDDDTIDQLIETGNSEQILHKAIQETGRGQVLDIVEEIQERHDAVKEIEKKLLVLHQIFLDMAVLVEAQGDMWDNIEIQVTEARDHIQLSGATDLTNSKNLQKKSARKCMMIAITIVLIIAIIVLLLLSIVKPWNKGKN